MTAMRVYLGSDHAGFELKQAIIEHLQKAGHEPIDCGAYVYDAEDDYPAFCIAAAEKTARRSGEPRHRDRRLGQRRADRREQGSRRPLCTDVERRDRNARHANTTMLK